MPDVMQTKFLPPRSWGLTLHVMAAILLFASSITLLVLAMQEPLGTFFILFLIFSLILLIPSFFTLYRLYALTRANYSVEREGLHLNWGLHREDIPLADVEWVQKAQESDATIRLPFLSLPGAILGHSKISGLGTVEFMASDANRLILVSTKKKVYAISPANSVGFLEIFRQAVELGSISPIPSASSLPAAYLQKVWSDRWSRWLIISGALLSILFMISTTLLVSSNSVVSLGFDPSGKPLEPLPSNRLLLLPILDIMVFMADLLGGLYFYRKETNRSIAFALWIGSLVTTMLLFSAALILFY